MPIYEYKCLKCREDFDVRKPMARSDKKEVCPKCRTIGTKLISLLSISGTRDSFGIGKEFTDPKNGKVIDTWKKWEQAGYKNPKDSPTLSSETKTKIKEKIARVKNKGNQKLSIPI